MTNGDRSMIKQKSSINSQQLNSQQLNIQDLLGINLVSGSLTTSSIQKVDRFRVLITDYNM